MKWEDELSVPANLIISSLLIQSPISPFMDTTRRSKQKSNRLDCCSGERGLGSNGKDVAGGWRKLLARNFPSRAKAAAEASATGFHDRILSTDRHPQGIASRPRVPRLVDQRSPGRKPVKDACEKRWPKTSNGRKSKEMVDVAGKRSQRHTKVSSRSLTKNCRARGPTQSGQPGGCRQLPPPRTHLR